MKPKNTLSVQFRNAKSFVSPHELFYLGFPSSYTLNNFIVGDILEYNRNLNPSFRKNPPAIFIAGLDLVKATLTPNLFEVLPTGSTISAATKPDDLTEKIYQEILHRRPACILLAGFENILFKNESPSETIEDVSLFIQDLQKIQAEFLKPIIISGMIHPRNADANSMCVPMLNNNKTEFELTTDRHENIQAPFGYFKLYHIPRTNPQPIKIFHGPTAFEWQSKYV